MLGATASANVPSDAVVAWVARKEFQVSAVTLTLARATPPAPVTLPLMWTALGSVTLMPVTSADAGVSDVAVSGSAVNPDVE